MQVPLPHRPALAAAPPIRERQLIDQAGVRTSKSTRDFSYNQTYVRAESGLRPVPNQMEACMRSFKSKRQASQDSGACPLKHQLGSETLHLSAVLHYREQVKTKQADLLAYLNPDLVIEAMFQTENWPIEQVEKLREHVRKEALARLVPTRKDSLSGALTWATDALINLTTLELRLQAQIGPRFVQHSRIQPLDE